MSSTFHRTKAPPAGAFCFAPARGFTLIELVAVIAIAGVLLVFATPRFLDMLPQEQRGYAEEIGANARYARSVAVASGCNVLFTVNAAGYGAAQRGASAVPFAGHCATAGGWVTPVTRADGTALAGIPPTRVNVAAAAQVQFDERGNVVGGGIVTFVVGPNTVTVLPGGGVSVR